MASGSGSPAALASSNHRWNWRIGSESQVRLVERPVAAGTAHSGSIPTSAQVSRGTQAIPAAAKRAATDGTAVEQGGRRDHLDAEFPDPVHRPQQRGARSRPRRRGRPRSARPAGGRPRPRRPGRAPWPLCARRTRTRPTSSATPWARASAPMVGPPTASKGPADGVDDRLAGLAKPRLRWRWRACRRRSRGSSPPEVSWNGGSRYS